MDKKIDLIAKLFITYIFILALCFLIYSLVVLPTGGAEKVNAIIGLLGWSATIFAPIAAYFLVDNWKEQTKYNEILKILASLINEITTLSNHITDLRTNKNLAIFLHLSITYIKDTKLTVEQTEIMLEKAAKDFPPPDVSMISKSIKVIKNLYLNLELYANNTHSLHDFSKYKTLVELRGLNFDTMVGLAYSDLDILNCRASNVELSKKLRNFFYISEYVGIALKDFMSDHDYDIDFFNYDYNEFIKHLDLLQKQIISYRKILK